MFKQLNEKFTKELMLAVLNLDKKKKKEMEVNVSYYAIKEVLSMKCKNK